MKRDPFADLEPLVQRVYAYVAYRLGPGPDAESLTARTFDMGFRHRAAFDPARDEPVPFLIEIAHRLLGEQGDEAGARVGERDRELVALRYGAELTPAQIGQILGVDARTVETGLAGTLARVRDAYRSM